MKRHGLTLVEVLVTMLILAVVLSVVARYFAAEARMTRLTQTRTEVQDKVRFLTQLLVQDLHLAGASRYVSSTNLIVKFDSSVFAPCSGSNYCLTVPGTVNSSGVNDALRTRYITSLRPQSEACRQVEYGWNGRTLQRSDVACGAALNLAELAGNIVALNLTYHCSDSTIKNSAVACLGSDPNAPTAYPRSARVEVYAASDQPYSRATPHSFTLADGTSVACPADRICFGASQEINLPNLKDK